MLNAFNQSLWGDEGFSAILSMKDSLWDVIKTVARDTSPPAWYISEWSAFKFFGASEVVVRSVSSFYFLLTIFFVYLIGKKVWNNKTAFFAALLTALNPFFFTYAFEGRMYSIMSAGVAGSMYFFLKILKGYPKLRNKTKAAKLKKWDFVGYVFFTLFALYSHHFAIFAIFVQGLWFLYEAIVGKRKAAKKIFKGFLLVAVGYIPWLYPLYNQTKMVGSGFWLSTPTIPDLFGIFGEYLAVGTKYMPFSFTISGYEIGPLEIALMLTLILLLLRKWHKNFKFGLLMLLWFTFPILATWGVSQKFQSIFFNRYLLYTIPAGMILLASSRRKISNYLIYAVIIIFALADWNYFTNPAKIPFDKLASYVMSTKEEGDLIINEDAGNHKLWESKFYGIPAPVYVPEGQELPFFVGTALMEEEDVVSEIPNNVGDLGVITYKDGAELKFPGFITVEEKRFGDLNFVWMSNTKNSIN